MKAITIWQPWASLLAYGAKQYETRSWATAYRGEIAIHAAKAWSKPVQMQITTIQKMLEVLKIRSFEKLPHGCIVATAELVNCWEIRIDSGEKGNEYHPALDSSYHATEQEILFGDWTPGRYAWEFANMKMLDEPIPAKGAQRIWNWNN